MFWSYCAMVELAILVLTSPIWSGRNRFVVLKKRINGSFATFSRRAYFSKPRMYGMTGGRGPVLKSGPRVER